MAKDTLSVTDNRTGKQYEMPIENGCIKAIDLRKIKTDDKDFGLMSYEPAFLNTANTKSSITFIDGDVGILEYRGYPIDQLAEKSTHLEVSYLLMNGELPNKVQLEEFTNKVTHHTYVHENIKSFMDGFRYDAHPMSMLASTVAALSSFYPEARNVKNKEVRRLQMMRLIAKMPTLAAFSYRHSQGLPYVYPNNDLGYTENFLTMVKSIGKPNWRPHPALVKALDLLFILHADHEQNCSTTATRVVGSSEVDPYSAVAAGITALYGPLHGGANEAVLRMLREIGDVKNVPEFISRVKEKGGDTKLMGFGQELRPPREGHQEGVRRGLRRHRQEPVARDRRRARAHRPAGRLLRHPQALPERRFLLGPDLRGDGLPRRLLHQPLRHSPHRGLGEPVGRDDHRQRAEDRPSPSGVHRQAQPRLRRHREALKALPPLS
jgi:citrate synthase